jgi:hypothetical protein
VSKLFAGVSSLAFAALIALSTLAGSAAPAHAAKGKSCSTASQCHGILPQLCIKCKNGGEGCAHWACVHHKCVVRYCSH